MRTQLKTAALAAMMTLSAFSAAAETSSPTVAHDPLMKQIMSRQLTLADGGVTGSTRLGSGQAITLSLVDPLAPLKPAEGLAPKPAVKAKARRKVRNVREQLRKMSDDERRADWSGRGK